MINDIFNFRHCTRKVKQAIEEGFDMAGEMRLEFITPEVILYCICNQKEFKELASYLRTDLKGLKGELKKYNESQDRVPEEDDYLGMASDALLYLLICTHIITYEGEHYVLPQETLWDEKMTGMKSLFKAFYLLKDSYAMYLLQKYIGKDDTWTDMALELYEKDYSNCANKLRKEKGLDSIHPDELLQSATDKAEEILEMLEEPKEKMVTNISATYKQKHRLIGREQELQRAVRVLCRKDKNNPLFVGEPGVGKTAIIYGLARWIDEDRVPKRLKGSTIYALDTVSLIAGTAYHGELEKRIKSVLDKIKRQKKGILYIDDVHAFVADDNNKGSMNIADIIKPYLESGEVRFIGTTTYQEYQKHIAANKTLARCFQLIDVKEPDVEESINILQGLLPDYERHHGVKYSDEAVRYAVEQSHHLIHDRYLPDKAIDIIDEAGAYLQQNPLLNKQGKPRQARYQRVDVSIVKGILTEVCRIDAKALTENGNELLKDLEQRINGEIFGQEEAVRQVVRAVMMAKAGLNEPGKPLASLLFVGPTGVGKTEVCKVLAQQLGIALVRFDMSEYTEKHTVSKLIGSPAGYVGYEEGGLLTDAVRKSPNCVLLLDEIEKAHTDIYNILLQVMDYAKLTDNKGNKTDFSNVIVIMTSNAGAQYATQAGIGFGGGQSKGTAMMTSVKKTFKPEFLNRLSGTVVFHDMNRKMAAMILQKKLGQLKQRLANKQVDMTLTPEAEQWLLDKGYTTQYGAREMDRAIQQHLTPLLMEEILFGKLKNGGCATISLNGDELTMD
ncbi:MAG: AAA family ATPase [Prevotella sp.]